MSDPVLSIRNLSIDYIGATTDFHAVKNVSFDIAPGEFFGLAGRQDELAAAEAAVAAAKAALAMAQWRLAERKAFAPAAGMITDTLYRPGEHVAAGAPVVELLPPDNVKLRFFVPEPLLGTLQIGQPIRFTCDGCPPDLGGRISFVAPEAEYTPPVIYSRESREKLVFLVEAEPDPAAPPLHPGQPVDVWLSAS